MPRRRTSRRSSPTARCARASRSSRSRTSPSCAPAASSPTSRPSASWPPPRRAASTPFTDFLPGKAFTSGLDWDLRMKKRYAVTGYLVGSSVRGNAEAIQLLQESTVHSFQRPDADHVEDDPTRTSHRAAAAARSRSARSPGRRSASTSTPASRRPGLDINDVGFMRRADRKLVGVTGTNGKTTTTYLLASVFDAAGLPAGRLGTVTFRVGPAACRRAGRVPHDARGGRNPAAASADGRSRLHGVRDRSLVARARAPSRRVSALRGRDLHEPHARPSRFSRGHAAVLRGQAPAVRHAAGRRAVDRQS